MAMSDELERLERAFAEATAGMSPATIQAIMAFDPDVCPIAGAEKACKIYERLLRLQRHRECVTRSEELFCLSF